MHFHVLSLCAQLCFTLPFVPPCLKSLEIVISEIRTFVIMVSVIVSAIGIAGLVAGIATVSHCVCIKRRKKTTIPVGWNQDHG